MGELMDLKFKPYVATTRYRVNTITSESPWQTLPVTGLRRNIG